MRVLVTGSSTGLGLLAGRELIRRGHEVVLHARNAAKAQPLVAEAEVLIGDLETLEGMNALADAAEASGPFDAVIHNAGVGERGTDRRTFDGVPVVFAVNILAPWVLTARMTKPGRLVYLSSSMHHGASVPAAALGAFWEGRWTGRTSYSQSKWMDTALAFGIARIWPEVESNAVDPGWVPTRMGGSSAPDDLTEGILTQCALVEGKLGPVTGQFLHHLRVESPDPAARDTGRQDALLDLCARISGVRLPR